ncbi:MAG: hypothetical protein AB9842_10555 [Bacteroidales bacterium]
MKKYRCSPSILTVIILNVVLFTTINYSCYSQNKSSEKQKNRVSGFDPDRLVFGGNLGFQFGTVTLVDVSPLIGYRFTDQIMAGAGISYQFFEDKRFDPDFSTSIYGGRLFGRYYFLENFFAHAEYELLNYDFGFVDPFGYFNTRRVNANNMYVGAGLVLPIGQRSAFNIMLLYNLNENAESLYSNPVYRVGFTIGM